eukprot:387258_1
MSRTDHIYTNIALQTEAHTTSDNEASSNKVSPNEVSPIAINLGDPMKSVKQSSYKWKYIICLVLALMNMGPSFPHFYASSLTSGTGVTNNVWRWVLLIFFIVLLLLCVILYVYVLKNRVSQKSWGYALSRTINIQEPTTIYELGVTEYLPLSIFGAVVWCCVANIILLSTFYETHMTHGTVCQIEDPPARCFAAESFACGGFIVAAFSVFLLLQTIECKDIIETERDKIEAKYANTAAIVERIDQRLKSEWRDSKKITNRRFEISFICTLILAFSVYEFTTSRQNIWHGGYPADVVLIGCILHLGDCVVVSGFFCLFQTVAFHHYHFFWHIMDELAAPINAQSAQDIVGWWELRKYYIHCVVSVYLPTYRLCMLCASTGCIVLAISYFNGGIGAILSICLIAYFTSMVFALTTQAVRYHGAQLSHLSTLNKERLQFKMNGAIGYAKDDEHEGWVYEIMDLIAIDIQRNTHPISVLGVRLDTNFMLFLRASAVTLCFALIFESS